MTIESDMKSRIVIILAVLLTLPNCAKKNDLWGDIDYSKVRRAAENDAGYVAPSISGCVDDDLINCK